MITSGFVAVSHSGFSKSIPISFPTLTYNLSFSLLLLEYDGGNEYSVNPTSFLEKLF